MIALTTLTIIILSITTVGAISFSIYRHFKYLDVSDKLEKVDKRNIELSTMFLSDKAIHRTRLTYDKKIRFNICYELEITEMTNESAKCDAISYTTEDSEMNQSKHKKSLLGYMKDRWIPIEDLEFIIDGDAAKREIRLEQLLDKK